MHHGVILLFDDLLIEGGLIMAAPRRGSELALRRDAAELTRLARSRTGPAAGSRGRGCSLPIAKDTIFFRDFVRTMRDLGIFSATTDFAAAAAADALIVCVPTPLTEHRSPDITYIESTCETLALYARPGQLFVSRIYDPARHDDPSRAPYPRRRSGGVTGGDGALRRRRRQNRPGFDYRNRRGRETDGKHLPFG